MRLLRMTAAAALTLATATACVGQGYGPNQVVGGLGGGALGGWLGSQIGEGEGKLAATAAGALIGAFVGQGIGTSMDQTNRSYSSSGPYRSPGYGAYNTPATGYAGYPSGYAAQPVYTQPSYSGYGTSGYAGGACQRVPATTNVGGYPQTVYVTACQDAYGRWSVVN